MMIHGTAGGSGLQVLGTVCPWAFAPVTPSQCPKKGRELEKQESTSGWKGLGVWIQVLGGWRELGPNKLPCPNLASESLENEESDKGIQNANVGVRDDEFERKLIV